ncbi:MAG: hypothetical protein AAFV54_00330 [Pseudomonadota bacterium]
MARFRLLDALRFSVPAALCAGMVYVFVVLPLTAPKFTVRQGEFIGVVAALAAGMGLGARMEQRALIEVEDGRAWWLSVPADQALAQGSKVKVEVVCTTDQFEQCTARYIGRPKS